MEDDAKEDKEERDCTGSSRGCLGEASYELHECPFKLGVYGEQNVTWKFKESL